jgi:putative addiction module component (TIGR02574 family)
LALRIVEVNLPAEIMSQVFALPADERYELAQHLLDSIDDSAAEELDERFIAELQRRREEMLRGEQVIVDWRAALSSIETSIAAELYL